MLGITYMTILHFFKPNINYISSLLNNFAITEIFMFHFNAK